MKATFEAKIKDTSFYPLRITARMFNAAAAVLAGKVQAAREAREQHAGRLKGKLRSLAESIAALEQDVKEAQGQGSRGAAQVRNTP